MRLIDADQMAVDESEAYLAAQGQITDDLTWLVNFGAHNKIQMLIADTPTVDAVPVVRCRECKYWGDEDGKVQRDDGLWFARCELHNYPVGHKHVGWCPTENDFCSQGERRKDNADR